AQLSDLGHLGLLVEDASSGIDADGDQVGGEVEDLVLDLVAVGLGREGVVVGDEVKAVVLVLEVHPVLGRAQVVAQVEAPGGTNAAENSQPIRHGWQPSLSGKARRGDFGPAGYD